MRLSASSSWRIRSPFSAWRRALVALRSWMLRALSSSLELNSEIWDSTCLLIFSDIPFKRLFAQGLERNAFHQLTPFFEALTTWSWSWSIWSAISLAESCAFFLREAMVDSLWSACSSRSRRIFWISASRFLLSSTWAAVWPPCSSRASAMSSSSRLLNAGLELLDLALKLGHKSLLLLKLLVQGLDLILLPGARAALSRGFTLT
ncbi:hypothetical protein MAR_036100 [Mya arenaria]|uniref:Uncharacterized protein n=1 Tax=Mya arenaria TaxID=6604 RepID=A0ABY7EPI0_MYAAR|nr:hypothetical protein MAR_036100 [Mya arenaria]